MNVAADHVFKAVLAHSSLADMPLFRGMFLSVALSATAAAPRTVAAVAVHQAFLPKFENDAQDAAVADAIVKQAGARYMVATIKHSGSLATLSHDLMGAKNSVCNEFTAAAVVLLRAHFQRLAAQRYATPTIHTQQHSTRAMPHSISHGFSSHVHRLPLNTCPDSCAQRSRVVHITARPSRHARPPLLSLQQP